MSIKTATHAWQGNSDSYTEAVTFCGILVLQLTQEDIATWAKAVEMRALPHG